MRDYSPSTEKMFREFQADPLMSTREVALYARVAVSTVANWAKQGLLPGIKTPTGGRWRFRRSEVVKMMELMGSIKER